MYIASYRDGEIIAVSLDISKIRQVVESLMVDEKGFSWIVEVYYWLLSNPEQKFLYSTYHRGYKHWVNESADIPKLDPLQEFAMAVYNKDPIACDAVRDILRI